MPVRLCTAKVNVFLYCEFIHKMLLIPRPPQQNNLIIDSYFTKFFIPLYFYLVYISLLLQLLNGSAFLLLLNSSVSWTWKMGSAISLIWPQNGHFSQLLLIIPFFSPKLCRRLCIKRISLLWPMEVNNPLAFSRGSQWGDGFYG